MSQPDAQRLAERVAVEMYARDNASKGLGMNVEAVAPGYARLSMAVRKDMVNGHDICHGGMIFTLADSAFAFACNSYNRTAVAQQASITFCRPAKLGDRLTAECHERHKAGRAGLYDVTVTDQSGKTVALFRGTSATIQGELVR
ncbi:MAG: hydroxyphenylacetyl-CoA thioesterase PaaI [Alphaproteobacteria bacterium]|nr:hydroxyphenylacetyl-CoA thioesterase PaaI [Alphaproteobacteria bacterium]